VVDPTMEAVEAFCKQLDGPDMDALRELVKVFVERLMAEQADQICGAGYGERSEARVNQRNGYRERAVDTRVGTIEVGIPKLREGSYVPDWLVEPRRRAERALVAVVAECYVRGVSTRRIDGLVRTLGIEHISKSRVSEMAKDLDETVSAFRNRPLDAGPYTYVWIDALRQKVREAGRIQNVAALVARGLSGVRLVISDAHPGLKDAIASTLQGASWQRCRTHFLRNLLTRVPKSAGPSIATLVRSIFMQPDAEAVWAQFHRVIEQLQERFPAAAEMLEAAGPEILAFTSFPQAHWRQIWSNNPQERLNKEIRRRTDVVGIFPNRDAAIRLMVPC
jgi:putative transposase